MNKELLGTLGAGFSPLLAMEEASRCLLCLDAPCSKGCPAGTDPGKFIRSIRFKNLKGAARTILTNNPLGFTCALVCPTERYCQLGCTRSGIDRPIDIAKLQRFALESMPNIDLHLPECLPANGKKVAVTDKTDSKSLTIKGMIEYYEEDGEVLRLAMPFEVVSTFKHDYAEIKGDMEACSQQTLEMVKAGHVPFPTNESLAVDAASKLNSLLMEQLK